MLKCICSSLISLNNCIFTNYLKYAFDRKFIDYEQYCNLLGTDSDITFIDNLAEIGPTQICIASPHTNSNFRLIEQEIEREFAEIFKKTNHFVI
jgi:hypothetical protein